MITVFASKDNHKNEPTNDYLESSENSWQAAMSGAIRDPIALLALLDLSDDKYTEQLYPIDKFKCLVPLSYVKKMEKGNFNDPLLRQVLPLLDETKSISGFIDDPVGDLNSEVSSGVLHKYQGRVLLVTTGACAVHCRYCFRQHFSYGDSLADKKNWQNTLALIGADKSISEVILSGGDPLMLSDKKLQKMCWEIAEITHVKTLRFHSRIPIFLPERINQEFLAWTAKLAIRKVMVIHANHANELDSLVGNALDGLRGSGFTLLNQSVLLRGVNDSEDDLVDLSHALFSLHVLPYYLHQLDKVKGAAHFEVDKKKAIALVHAIKDSLPGYLVPRLVEEISGKRSKQAIV